jgi:hypothetical protein
MATKTAPVEERIYGNAVTLKIARHVMWLRGDEEHGQDGGDYVTRLWRLITVADQANLELLRSIHPGYVEAFEAAMRTSWGFEWLRKIATGVTA